MSFGTHEGARDGSSALELAIDKPMHDANGDPVPGRAVMVSAGNEGDARWHGRKNINAFANLSFRLEVEEIVFPNGEQTARRPRRRPALLLVRRRGEDRVTRHAAAVDPERVDVGRASRASSPSAARRS